MLRSQFYLQIILVTFIHLGLFGEGPAERRDRLKDLLLRLGPAARKRLAEDPTEAAERVCLLSCNFVIEYPITTFTF